MKQRILMTTLCAAAFAVPAGVSTAAALGGGNAAGSLQLNATFGAGYTLGRQYCPAGTPSTADDCVRFTGSADVPGIGHVNETYTKVFDDTVCPGEVTSQRSVLFQVSGKGEIEVAMDSWPACAAPAASDPNGVTSVLEGTVARGTGKFAGASGHLTVVNHVSPPSCGSGGCRGAAVDTWTGTLVVPGMEFDLTPPVLSGAKSKTVKAAKKAKFVRVRYSVKAQDDVDGAVPVKCKPASGSRFKVGRRTKVNCAAEDTSANTATATFTVTVKRRG